MKLKEKVKILLDNDSIREVSGTTFTVEGINLEFAVHESRDGWREGLADITEKSTGLRLCFKGGNNIIKMTLRNAVEEVHQAIKEHGIHAIMKVITGARKLEEIEKA